MRLILGFSIIFGLGYLHMSDFKFSARAEVAQKGDRVISISTPENPEELPNIVEVNHANDNEPWRMIRQLQNVQDQIASGEPDAQKIYRDLIEKIADELKSLDDDVWQKKRNLDSVGLFVLIGGDVEVAYKALQKSRLDEAEKKPLSAALAFAERDTQKASFLFETLDHTELPYSVAPQYSLAKAMTYSASNLIKAKTFLSEARKLAPGTLIEEAALRRAIRITGETNSFDEFIKLSRTYMRRFHKSYYFKDFLRNYAYSAVRMPPSIERDVLQELQILMAKLDVSDQAAVSVYVAKKAAVVGLNELGWWASNHALSFLRQGSTTFLKMQLYRAASGIVKPEESRQVLEIAQSLNVKNLGNFDRKIRESILTLGHGILRESGIDNPENLPVGILNAEDAVEEAIKSSSQQIEYADQNPTIVEAMQAMEAYDKLVEEKKRVLAY